MLPMLLFKKKSPFCVVSSQLWQTAFGSLNPNPTDSCPLYLNHAVVAALPPRVSRHNSPSSAHFVSRLVRSCLPGGNSRCIVVSLCYTKSELSVFLRLARFCFLSLQRKILVGEKLMTQVESCESAESKFMRFNWGWCCKKGMGIYEYVVYKYQAPSSRSDILTCLEFKLRHLQRLHLARDSVLCPAPPDGVRALRCVCLGLCHRQGLPHLHPPLLGLTQGREEARDRGAADRRARQ